MARSSDQTNHASRKLSMLSLFSLICLVVAALASIYYLRKAGLGSETPPPVISGAQDIGDTK